MDHQIDDGLTLQPLPGHTPGMVGLNIRSGSEEAVLRGDMMHHMIQCHIPEWSTIACADMMLRAERGVRSWTDMPTPM